jgi:hypothetical protein
MKDINSVNLVSEFISILLVRRVIFFVISFLKCEHNLQSISSESFNSRRQTIVIRIIRYFIR